MTATAAKSAREVIELLALDETVATYRDESWVIAGRVGTSVVTYIGGTLTMHEHADETEAHECYAGIEDRLNLASLINQANSGNPFPLFARLDSQQ